MLGTCCAVALEYDEIKDTYLVGHDDSWLVSVQKDQMTKFLRVKVIAARVHAQPKCRLLNTKIPKNIVRRLTIMRNSEGKTKV